tara:strand:+ start:121 stop:519 length:399 start_codon:yes stop_codon:yes gene_type:complete
MVRRKRENYTTSSSNANVSWGPVHKNKYIAGYPGLESDMSFDTLDEAKEACVANPDCQGVTYVSSGKYEQRGIIGDNQHGTKLLMDSPSSEESYVITRGVGGEGGSMKLIIGVVIGVLVLLAIIYLAMQGRK